MEKGNGVMHVNPFFMSVCRNEINGGYRLNKPSNHDEARSEANRRTRSL